MWLTVTIRSGSAIIGHDGLGEFLVEAAGNHADPGERTDSRECGSAQVRRVPGNASLAGPFAVRNPPIKSADELPEGRNQAPGGGFGGTWSLSHGAIHTVASIV